MNILEWDELIPEAQIYMLKKQYKEQQKYSIQSFRKNIWAPKSTGGFDWTSEDSRTILCIIQGNFRVLFKEYMYLFLYKYIIK